MTINIAINGFGRIGRLVFRKAIMDDNINVVAINDLVPSKQLAYLLKYDSIHGRFQENIEAEEDKLIVNGKKIVVCAERDPSDLPWGKLGVDYVVESTGLFATKEGAEKHIKAGAQRVLISAPGKGGGITTIVMGVNEHVFDPKRDKVVSNASCTTNCLAPITKVLLDSFGIEEGLMTTVHAVTSSQPSVDGPSKKNWRLGRSAFQNIIPSTTGAAKAVALCLPELEGKLTGMALRVPLADVSVVDLTVKLSKRTTYEEICQKIKQAADGPMKGVLAYCDEAVVSTDFIGSSYSSIFDSDAGIALNETFYKLIAWYDNEMGYASRVIDLLTYMSK